MRVVIIEDEALTAKNLVRLLKQFDPTVEVMATIDSVQSAVKWIQTHDAPDLYFMDIQLSDGVSFDIFDKVKVERPVIFVTAYNEYAIRAFKVNSVDYLLKPLDAEQLNFALDKFKRNYSITNANGSENLNVFIDAFKKKELPGYKERFLAHYKSGIVPVPAQRVAYFVKDTIIYLVTTDNEKLVTDYNTLEEIEDVIDPHLFFRANRQTILHIAQIETYKKHDTGKIEVQIKADRNTRIDISREKANEFKSWIDT